MELLERGSFLSLWGLWATVAPPHNRTATLRSPSVCQYTPLGFAHCSLVVTNQRHKSKLVRPVGPLGAYRGLPPWHNCFGTLERREGPIRSGSESHRHRELSIFTSFPQHTPPASVCAAPSTTTSRFPDCKLTSTEAPASGYGDAAKARLVGDPNGPPPKGWRERAHSPTSWPNDREPEALPLPTSTLSWWSETRARQGQRVVRGLTTKSHTTRLRVG